MAALFAVERTASAEQRLAAATCDSAFELREFGGSNARTDRNGSA
jgi:hypothetical protein